MSEKKFRALVITEIEDKKYERDLTEKPISELPENDVLVKVEYSALNYKDALSAIGNRGVTRNYPHTPGVDAAGKVEESSNDEFKVGEEVIVHGYDLGMDTPGGFGEYIRVPSDWVVKLPGNLTLRESMCFGTAGFTAAYSLLKLEENGVKPEMGEILVTGATGGVGSNAVAILSNAGYQVVASTGKTEQQQFLTDLGASEIISREESIDESGKLLLKARFTGVVDTVGGDILATAIKSTKPRGTVTTCGNVGGHELNINVYPFILRGVNLVGIDSASCPMNERVMIWEKMANDWKHNDLDKITKEISLEQLGENIDLILQGKQKGHVLVNLGK